MYHIDVAVYLEGGLAFLRGENLYTQDFDFGSISLPFTYPPISAIVFSALAPFPLWVSSLVFIVATVILLWWCCVIVLRHAVSGWGVGRTRIVALAILPFVVALEPVRETLGFAQVNVFLMAMVMVETGGDLGHAPARATYEGLGFQRWPVARYFKDLADGD